MRLLPVSVVMAISIAACTAAMTIEEFATQPPEEKIKVLRGNPGKLLADKSQLLRLYTTSLRDSSPAVQKAAAQASVYLVLGLQSAKPRGILPSFSDVDSAAYQQALVALLAHDDEGIRSPVAVALAYSAPPNEAIESLLLDRTANESSQELKAAVLGAMGQAGYRSDRFVAATLALIQPDVDTRAIYTATQVLALARPESALDTLISLASKNSPSQQYSLRALAAYGQRAARARPVLERALTDQAVPEDIHNLIRIALQAIITDKPQASNLQQGNLVSLWPLAVTVPVPVVNQHAPNGAPEYPRATPSTQAPVAPLTVSPRPTTAVTGNPVERRGLVWALVAGMAALIAIIAFILKRRA